MQPRLLTLEDVGEPTHRLTSAAGWNQTEDDWRRLLRLSPQGCFGIDVDNALAATASTICYGSQLAWIGMVLTHPDFRRRGLARALMEHALAYLERQGVACIKLDATDLGRPLYEDLGFRSEGAVQRFVREADAGAARPVSLAAFQLDPSLDVTAFGADRGTLLADLSLVESTSLPSGSYAMGRPGANAAYFGPCVARTSEDAATLLGWFLGRHSRERIFWDILPEIAAAVGLAKAHGFVCARSLARMSLGRSPVVTNPAVWAIAGFEYG